MGIGENAPRAETNQMGAKLGGTSFDPTDWADVATILAQAAGVTPTRVSQTWEALRQVQDVESVYKARKQAIYVDMAKALSEGDKAAEAEVFKAVARYNADVKAAGDPQFSIQGNQLKTSIQQRFTQKAWMETTGAKNKSELGLTRRVTQELFPGVRLEAEKRVK